MEQVTRPEPIIVVWMSSAAVAGSGLFLLRRYAEHVPCRQAALEGVIFGIGLLPASTLFLYWFFTMLNALQENFGVVVCSMVIGFAIRA